MGMYHAPIEAIYIVRKQIHHLAYSRLRQGGFAQSKGLSVNKGAHSDANSESQMVQSYHESVRNKHLDGLDGDHWTSVDDCIFSTDVRLIRVEIFQ